jgi:hypothetical protein
MAAAAHWTDATALAPPSGVSAEKLRSGMPKLVIKSSATMGPIANGMSPSMSRGDSPASFSALSAASS